MGARVEAKLSSRAYRRLFMHAYEIVINYQTSWKDNTSKYRVQKLGVLLLKPDTTVILEN